MTAELMLVLDRRDVFVRLEGQALRVERTDGGLQRVPLGVLGMVVVHGAPAVTCDVWRALAERRIPAFLAPLRGQGSGAWLGPGLSTAIQVRRRQHAAAREPGVVLTVARTLVGLKLQQQRRLLEGLPAALEFGPTDELAQVLEEQRRALAGAVDVPGLMGMEGAAAAAWYGWLAGQLPAHWQFAGRNRRPPRDPVNALLSLGYTLLMGEVMSVVQEAGLDPALGFLHGVVPGRESLVLDLMEPLRSGVDAGVLALLDTVMEPAHFTHHPVQGCRLNKDGRGLFYMTWAGWRQRWLVPLPVDGEMATVDGSVAADDPSTEVDQSVRVQCLRMIRVLRALLPAVEAGDEFGEGGGDG